MEIVGKIESGKDAKEALDALESKFKSGYSPNAFGVKLPIGDYWVGTANGDKPYRSWFKSEDSKGLILGVIAEFDVIVNGVTKTVKDTVNFTSFDEWKKVGKGYKFAVSVAPKSATDSTLVCKLVPLKSDATVLNAKPAKAPKAPKAN